MNKKGFTLIELLATLVVLGIIMGFTFVSINGVFKNAKEKSEEAFIGTIKDAMEMYLAEDARKLDDFEDTDCNITKSYGSRKVYKKEVNFGDVIENGSLIQSEIVNPANEEDECALAENIKVTIYKDEDFVYYYSIDKSEFECLLNINEEYGTTINNFPEGFGCE